MRGGSRGCGHPRASFRDAAAEIWRIGQEDLRRAAFLVGISAALRRTLDLGPDAPGLWGALPRPGESRSRFADRFGATLARQAGDGIEELALLETWRRRGADALLGIRTSSRLPEALDMLLESRVLSPVALSIGIGVSVRGASQMLDELERRGVAVEVTGRRTYRRFVHVDDRIARRIMVSETRRPRALPSPPQAPAADPPEASPTPRRLEPVLPVDLAAFARDALEEAFAAVDAASSNVALALARLRGERDDEKDEAPVIPARDD